MTTPDPEMQDIGDIAEVPPEDRREDDEGNGSNALDGGADNDVSDVYANPGEVLELSEGPQ
jgi:hypothetical protein